MSEPLERSPYRVLRRLAVGGMGEVLLARTEGDDRVGLGPGLVVIKRTLPKHPNIDHHNRMLREEGRISLRLRHANLVETFALDQVEGTPLLVMEYLAGRSMAQVLGAAKRNQEMVPWEAAVKIVHEAACGLHFAHTLREGDKLAGLVHRDVSPANIFVTFDGRVKVIDFGVAKADDSEIKTSTGVLKGKIGYMSPEHTLGEKLDPRSDLWSLGVLLWESLVADRLFASSNPALTLHKINNAEIPRPSSRRADLPAAVDELVMKLLARSKEERVKSGAELVHLCEAITDANWRMADLGKFLTERFPDEAERGREESREAARARGEPVPQGLITGTTQSAADLEAATVVASRRDLIEAARQMAGADSELDEDARTVRLTAAQIAEITGKGALSPAPAVAARPLPGTGRDDDDARTVAGVRPSSLESLVTEPEAPPLSDAGEAPKGREGATRTSPETPRSREASGPQRASEAPAKRRPSRRKGPAWSSVALGTFGSLACVMGLVFALVRGEPEPVFVAYAAKAGDAETLVGRIDVPEQAIEYKRFVNAESPKLRLEANRPAVVIPRERFLAELEQAGVLARAVLPHNSRSRLAAGLPPLFLILGLLALAWSVPSFLMRGVMAWAARGVLLATVLLLGAWGAKHGLLGWPGLDALGGPAARLPAAGFAGLGEGPQGGQEAADKAPAK